MKQIRNYDEIIIYSNSLVILDIDDTIIKFNNISKRWWSDINYQYSLYYDKNVAYNLAFNKWKSIVENEKPILLDEVLFFDLINRINMSNSILLLLTARDDNLKELTIKNIKDCKININPNNIYFDYKKGNKIKELINIYPDRHVIFVDDVIDNVIDVENIMSDSIITCYLINHINANY